MTIAEITAKVKEIRELQALIDEATAEAETLKDEVKAYMGESEELRREGKHDVQSQGDMQSG